MKRIISSDVIKTAISNSIPDFKKILGNSSVITQESLRRQFAKDEGHFVASPPEIVLSPKNTEQVSKILKICNSRKIPVVPFGTGTGLEGGSLSITDGVCISTAQISADHKLHHDDFVCTVKPAITRLALNESIKDSGLFFPIDPGADASICGMVATGASGTNAVKYGTMKENVINLEIVLADGSIIYTKGQGRFPRKSCAGYNITELFVGSEGTLGIITEATIRVHPRPQIQLVAVCSFPNVQSAANGVMEIHKFGVPVSRIEFLDTNQIIACNKYSNLSLIAKPHLFFEIHASDENEAEWRLSTIREICKNHDMIQYNTSGSSNQLWKARHDAYYATLAMKPGSKGFTTDVCVPISRLAEVINATTDDLEKNNIFGTIVGHVGDGNFHVILPTFHHDTAHHRRIQQFSDRLVLRALSANGTCTGEHGIGIGKKKYLREELGNTTVRLMRSLKETLDPNNIMNPGKMLPDI